MVGSAASSAAGAATIRGTSRADLLRGTARADFLDGLGGRDRILARGGDDRIRAQDRARDTISCGAGRDLVNADAVDAVARDCEVVARQISRDTYREPLGQHESQVEPDTFAFGSTIVSVFQSGRIVDGGASNNGFSTSLDGGRTWRAGFLPGLTRHSAPPGADDRASDPVIGYDARHGVWLASSLLVSPGQGGAIVVNRSADGLRWDVPVTVTESRSRPQLDLDKQWVACDNTPTSPFYGNCYHAYSDLRTLRMSVQTSRDGGLTWSAPIGSPDNAGRTSILGRFAPAPQPVVRPDGVLVIPFNDDFRIAAVRSLDGGATLTPATTVAPLDFESDGRLRDPPLPSAEVAGDGSVYVVWPNCVDSGCRAELLFASSADGVTWSPARPVPTGSAPRKVLPGLAVDPASRAPAIRLALVYYGVTTAGLTANFVASSDGGATWTPPQRLSAETMPIAWLPATSQGAMVGDYFSTSFVGRNAVAVFAIASRPARLLNQAMFAAVLPVD